MIKRPGCIDGNAGARSRLPQTAEEPVVVCAYSQESAREILGEGANSVWQTLLRENDFAATAYGERGEHDARVPDLRPEAREESLRRIQEEARALAQLRPSLGDEDQDVLVHIEHIAQRRTENAPLRTYEFNLCQMNEDVHTDLLNLGDYVHTIRTEADAHNLNARYSQAPTLLAQRADNLRQGKAGGRVQAKVIVDAVIRQLDKQIALLSSPASIADSEYLNTLRQSPLNPRQKVEAAGTLTSTLQEQLKPALEAYRSFLANEYVGRDPESLSPGLAGMKGGDEAYLDAMAAQTDKRRSPLVVHAKAWARVEHWERELRTIGERILGDEAKDLSFPDLLRRVQNRKENRFDSPERAEKAVRALIDLAMEELSKFWGIELTEEQKKIYFKVDTRYAAAAYKRGPEGTPGTYFWNPEGSSSPSEMPSQVLHELTHHFASIATQMADGPAIVKKMFTEASTEGQGLHAEGFMSFYEKAAKLFKEIGGNGATHDDILFGTYSTQMLRAIRPVLDTGLHYFGWSREHTIDVACDYLPFPRERIAAEVDRYIGMPAQAISYALGDEEHAWLLRETVAMHGEDAAVPLRADWLLKGRGGPLPVVESVTRRFQRTYAPGGGESAS